jgi:hypothetical protein
MYLRGGKAAELAERHWLDVEPIQPRTFASALPYLCAVSKSADHGKERNTLYPSLFHYAD